MLHPPETVSGADPRYWVGTCAATGTKPAAKFAAQKGALAAGMAALQQNDPTGQGAKDLGKRPYSFVDYLVAVGSKLSGVECIGKEEALSAMDFARREALIGRVDRLNADVPLLLPDDFQKSKFDFYKTQSEEERFRKGCFNLSKQKMSLCGGCFIDLGHAAAPAAILFSKERNVMIVYVPQADIAGMEQAFRNATRAPDKTWEHFAPPDAVLDISTAMQDAMNDVTNVDPGEVPPFLFSDSDYHVARFGIFPFLKLRHPVDRCEVDRVRLMLTSLQNVVAAAKVPLTQELATMKHVLACSVFDSGIACGAKDFARAAQHEIDEAVATMMMTPVLAACAAALLSKVVDDAVDANGEAVSEVSWDCPLLPKFDWLLRETCAKEEAALLRVKNFSNESAMKGYYSFSKAPLVIPELMKGIPDPYTVELVCNGEDSSTREIVEACVKHFFAEAAERVLACLAMDPPTAIANPVSALLMLGKRFLRDRAMVVAPRESDGRLSAPVMVFGGSVVPNLSRDAIRRSFFLAKVRFIIVDKRRIFELKVGAEKPPCELPPDLEPAQTAHPGENKGVSPPPIAPPPVPQPQPEQPPQSEKLEQLEQKVSAMMKMLQEVSGTLATVSSEMAISAAERKKDCWRTACLKRSLSSLDAYEKRFRAH